MKKLFLIPALLFSISLCAQKYQLGLKGGVNLSNFTGGDFKAVKNSSLLGFHAGGFISFLAGSNFAIQPEVLFSTQGAKLENAGDKRDFKVSYLNVPVMFKYRTNGGFYLEAGPQVGFKLGEDEYGSVNNFAKNLDLAVNAGLGYHSSSGFGIGGRYSAGISKVGDFTGQNIEPDFKNSVVQLFIFFTLFNNKR